MEPVFLVYNDHYRIKFGDGYSSTMDPDGGKKIHDRLAEDSLIDGNSFIDPSMMSLEELSDVHTPEYVDVLNEELSRFFTLSGLELLVSPELWIVKEFFVKDFF